MKKDKNFFSEFSLVLEGPLKRIKTLIGKLKQFDVLACFMINKQKMKMRTKIVKYKIK